MRIQTTRLSNFANPDSQNMRIHKIWIRSLYDFCESRIRIIWYWMRIRIRISMNFQLYANKTLPGIPIMRFRIRRKCEFVHLSESIEIMDLHLWKLTCGIRMDSQKMRIHANPCEKCESMRIPASPDSHANLIWVQIHGFAELWLLCQVQTRIKK